MCKDILKLDKDIAEYYEGYYIQLIKEYETYVLFDELYNELMIVNSLFYARLEVKKLRDTHFDENHTYYNIISNLPHFYNRF